MAKQDLPDVGKEILNAVTHAVDSGDFSTLSDEIGRTVSGVTKEAVNSFLYGSSAGQSTRPGASRNQHYTGQSYSRNSTSARPSQGETITDQWIRQHREETARQQREAAARNAQQAQQTALTPFLNKKVDKTPAKVKTIVGAIGTVGNGIASVLSLIFAGAAALFTNVGILAAGATTLVGFFLVMTGLFAYLLVSGRRDSAMIDQYLAYGKLAGQSEYLDLKEFALKVGETPKALVKNIQRMIKRGLLPKAHLDQQQTTLMLTDHAYQLYVDAIGSSKLREQQERLSKIAEKYGKEDAKKDAAYSTAGLPEDAASLIREGERYIRTVREINDRIPDTEIMSDKLYRLEDIMNRIFRKVRSDPSLAPSLRRFMSYYLPTTQKLLNAYVLPNGQPEIGDNITKTKQEIVDAMDTINDAYEQLLNDLFQDVAWDVSSDISVMKSMLAQDGLAGRASPAQPEPVPVMDVPAEEKPALVFEEP